MSMDGSGNDSYPSKALHAALSIGPANPGTCAVDLHCFLLHRSALSKSDLLHKVSVQSKEVFVTQQEHFLV